LVGIDLIQFSIDYVKKFLNWLRTRCGVSITTVATWWSVSQNTRPLCFYRNSVHCAVSKVTSVRSAVFPPRCRPTIVLLVYCPVDNTMLPRNSLFGCVNSLLLLWKPRSQF